MPNHEEHCQHSLKLYGERADDIHAWIDKPSKKWRQHHRQFRHDTKAVKLAGKIFGRKCGHELAQNIALDHIMLDHEEEVRRENENLSTPNHASESIISQSVDFHISNKTMIMYRKNKQVDNNVALSDSLPPINIAYYSPNRTIIDNVYSVFSDKQKVISNLQLLGYEACTVQELRNSYFKTDLEIKRLLFESSQITAEQMKDILRYAGQEELIDTSKLTPYKFPKKVFFSLLAPNIILLFLY